MKIYRLSKALNLVADNGRYYLQKSGAKNIPLEEVKTDKELVKLRMNTKCTILKFADRTFYTTQPIGSDCHHLCGTCKRCSAAIDPKGCAKIRDPLINANAQSNPEIVDDSKRIEKYPFIRGGWQNDKDFIVLSCKNYEYESNVRKGPSPNSVEMLRIKHALSQFFDERMTFEQFLRWHGVSARRNTESVEPFTRFPY